MRKHLCLPLLLLFSPAVFAQPFANRLLSNLSSPTAINVSLLPATTNSTNLGSSTLKWKTIYLTNIAFPNGTTQTTAYTPYSAGTGISISGSSIINSSPDKIVNLTSGSGIAVSGSYPNFTIAATGNNSSSTGWTMGTSSVYCNATNVGIGTSSPTAKLEVAEGDAKIHGLTIGVGNGNFTSNTVVGNSAMNSNVTGFSNTVYGNQALFSNTDGYDNSAFGENALYSNIDGIENTALGNGTLYSNISGYGNTAVGNGALLNNGAVPNTVGAPDASYNAANGFFSLFNNTTGYQNTGVGTSALYGNSTGFNNTSLGAYSDVALDNLTNATSIGANSIVNSSDKIRLGDVNVTVVESAAGSWTTSDGRFKTNVKETVVGLPFIKLLRPVMYNFDADKFDDFLSQHFPDSIKAKRKAALKARKSTSNQVVQTGFIAQEVEEAATKSGYSFNGVHVPVSKDDNYSISYEKMVVPLVKAVQELAEQNEEMKKEIALLKTMVNKESNTATQTVQVTSAGILQNAPNPFKSSTNISYNLPENVLSAEIIISDVQGKSLKRIVLPSTATTKGIIAINGNAMAAGTYQYALYINGRVADSKQMIIAK